MRTDHPKHLDYLLTAYALDNISVAGKLEVERHLAQCPSCRAELHGLRATLGIAEEAFASDTKEYVFEAQRKQRVLNAAKHAHGRFAQAIPIKARSGSILRKWSWKLGAIAALLCVLAVTVPMMTNITKDAKVSYKLMDKLSDGEYHGVATTTTKANLKPIAKSEYPSGIDLNGGTLSKDVAKEEPKSAAAARPFGYSRNSEPKTESGTGAAIPSSGISLNDTERGGGGSGGAQLEGILGTGSAGSLGGGGGGKGAVANGVGHGSFGNRNSEGRKLADKKPEKAPAEQRFESAFPMDVSNGISQPARGEVKDGKSNGNVQDSSTSAIVPSLDIFSLNKTETDAKEIAVGDVSMMTAANLKVMKNEIRDLRLEMKGVKGAESGEQKESKKDVAIAAKDDLIITFQDDSGAGAMMRQQAQDAREQASRAAQSTFANGTGTWELKGQNTYSGITTLSAGTSFAPKVPPLEASGLLQTGAKLSINGLAQVWDGVNKEKGDLSIDGTSLKAPEVGKQTEGLLLLGQGYADEFTKTERMFDNHDQKIVSRNLILPGNDPLLSAAANNGRFEEQESRSFDPFQILKQQREKRTVDLHSNPETATSYGYSPGHDLSNSRTLDGTKTKDKTIIRQLELSPGDRTDVTKLKVQPLKNLNYFEDEKLGEKSVSGIQSTPSTPSGQLSMWTKPTWNSKDTTSHKMFAKNDSVTVEMEPAVFETRTRKVCTTPASCTYETQPAVFETRTRKVQINADKPGEPPLYKDEEYKVCVTPESRRSPQIPAEYKDEEYQFCVKPADWKFKSPEIAELYLRGYRVLHQENPKLVFTQFLRRPELAQPVPLSDEGLDEDDYAAKYGTRPFVDCARDHFSTFGLDVDTAAYTLARAALRADTLPEPSSVRTEEFLNYFKQPYQVQGDEAFGVFAESAQSPFVDTPAQTRDVALLGTEHPHTRELLKIGIKSREARPGERKPAMLTFVIDTSGSMGEPAIKNSGLTRLGLVKNALNGLIEALNPEDAVSIVGFGDQAELILPRTQARQKQRILDAIQALSPSGATHVEAGLNLGYRMADEALSSNAVNRMILFSDGVAGSAKPGSDDMIKLVKLFAARGVELSTVGVGMGKINDPMLRSLADEGNGACHYADTIAEAQKILFEKLPPHLNVLARDAKVQVDFNVDAVKSYRLLGYEKRKIADKDFRNDKIDSGDVGHDTLVTVFYEIVRQPGIHGPLGKVYLRWKDAGSPRLEVVERNYPLEESTYAGPASNASPDFRFLACVARFAELLRESKWVRQGSYAEVLTELRNLPPEFKAKAECAEVIELVERAQRLSIAKWKSEIAR